MAPNKITSFNPHYFYKSLIYKQKHQGHKPLQILERTFGKVQSVAQHVSSKPRESAIPGLSSSESSTINQRMRSHNQKQTQDT